MVRFSSQKVQFQLTFLKEKQRKKSTAVFLFQISKMMRLMEEKKYILIIFQRHPCNNFINYTLEVLNRFKIMNLFVKSFFKFSKIYVVIQIGENVFFKEYILIMSFLQKQQRYLFPLVKKFQGVIFSQLYFQPPFQQIFGCRLLVNLAIDLCLLLKFMYIFSKIYNYKICVIQIGVNLTS
eukprot:TRINITY_DN4771_c0_g2_i1.p6 TRINITY_DN4771_c0_g2~~TRINITY_DN4771_c0_g2_i1.p6  ORF type:complete len:180 (-),score=1.43 TRINITY_DN4771_c0_g2_i1:2702-3241(-)